MAFKFMVILFLTSLTLSAEETAQADEVYTFVIKKQEQKAVHRWSLQEWLDTRDRMRLMDLWLALHTPEPYEFFLGGAFQLGSVSAGGSNFTGVNLNAGAYASIFGLQFEYQGGVDTRYDTTFALRFFGYHYQATHVRAEVGLRRESSGQLSFQNALAGVGLAVYFSKYFGVDARWRHAFSSTPSALGIAFGGDRYEGGAFIDFSFLRVYGKYVYELGTDVTTRAPGTVRAGPEAGVVLFF
jgi:hypothetical protein